MKNSIQVLSLLLFLLLFGGCRESVLNEIVIDDPNLFRVKVKIDQNYNGNRNLQVSIRDKTNHPIELNRGEVFVNGYEASYYLKTVITPARGYNYSIPYGEDSFEITIYWNDNDAYTFWVDHDNGFPGFDGYHYAKGEYEISPAPFYRGVVKVEYDLRN